MRMPQEEGMRDQFVGDGIILDHALMYWVTRVHMRVREAAYTMFRDAGVEITPEQWMVLVRLWEQEGRTPSELSDVTFRDRPTMTRILDGMAVRGWLERRPDPVDARSRRVYLTVAGRELKAILVPRVRRLVQPMLDGISDADIETTRRTLRAVLANLEGTGEGEPA